MGVARMSATPAPWACNDQMRWRFLAGMLILAITVLRLAYLFFWCPLDLVPDEAHYWDWSRHLDWSYYSKGPLIAWLIRASCEFFGPLSQSITGSEMAAVRIPAVLCGSLMLGGLYLLTVQILHDERLGFLVVVGMMMQPVIALGSLLMTIDAPFTCCWTWALVTGHRAVMTDSRWNWILTGLLVGIGVLAKYTMATLAFFAVSLSGVYARNAQHPATAKSLAHDRCCLPVLHSDSYLELEK